eukprot:708296-Rhodomonas_salina.1
MSKQFLRTDACNVSNSGTDNLFCSQLASAKQIIGTAAEKSTAVEMVMDRAWVSLLALSMRAFCWAGESQALSIKMQWLKALLARCFCAAL